jgi:inositol-phosphate phosphatase/L-galactose 1-phosphate phosphatase/histidinol-phosphatase
MTDLAAAVAVAERLADAARPVIMGYYRSGVAIDAKDDLTPVTAADREAETLMRTMILDAFPDHGLLGEEWGAERADAEWVWVLDPIDGTKSFVTGKPLFGTLIGLMHNGEPVAGIIDMPALDERWVGAADRPTTWNGRPVSARPCGDLQRAWLYATSPFMFQGADAAAFARLAGRCRASVFGADCYAYGLVALGTVDLVCEAGLKPYDWCAVVPVVQGAGGSVVDWHGRPMTLASDGHVVAAGSRRTLDAALATLAG